MFQQPHQAGHEGSAYSPSEVPTRTYFTTNELIFYATHGEDDNLNERLQELAVRFTEYGVWNGEFASIHIARVDATSSLISLKSGDTGVVDLDEKPDILEERRNVLIGQLVNAYQFVQPETGEESQEDVEDSPVNNEDTDFISGVQIRAASPNWFITPTSHVSIGSHGPGGPPRAVVDPAMVDNLHFDLCAFNQNEQNEQNPSDACEETIVYILDTIPPKERIQAALSNWSLLEPFEPILAAIPDLNTDCSANHPHRYCTEKATYIYEEEMHNGFPTTFITESGGEMHYAPGMHDYDLSDHGLFVTSIIHSIVPDVKKYVIQVMDNHGAGTLMNFVAGFQKIREIHQQNHIDACAVINCSFTITLDVSVLEAMESLEVNFQQQLQMLWSSLYATIAHNAIMVAAAGNDSNRDVTNGKHGTGYPAKLDAVVGVGALKHDRTTMARYSNVADQAQSRRNPEGVTPADRGIYAFGGDYDDQPSRVPADRMDTQYPSDNGQSRGMIGIFTGNLNIDIGGHNRRHAHNHHDDHEERSNQAAQAPALSRLTARVFEPSIFYNPTGYAEWKGTSFAAPIVTGVIALLTSRDHISPDAALAIVNDKCVPPNGTIRRLKSVMQVNN